MAPVGSQATVEATPPDPWPTQPLKWTVPNSQGFEYMPLPTSEETAISSDPWMPSSGLTALPSSPRGDNLDLFGSRHFSGGADGAKAHGGKHGKDNSDSEAEALPAKMIKSEDGRQSSATADEFGTPPEAMNCEAPPTTATGQEASPSTTVDEPQATPQARPQAIPQAVVMEWHSCSICLEEMVDVDLLTHRECGAIVCPSCLQASTEHYSKDGEFLPCPVSV